MDIQAQLQFVYDEIKGVWRYRWIAVGVAWIIATVGWLGLSLMPNKYEATSKVFVDTATSVKPLLQGLPIDTDTQSQIDLVRLALMSRPHLSKVAEHMGLINSSMKPPERERQLDALAKQIHVTGESRGSQRTYTIKYEDVDRERSALLVKTLIDNFVNEVLGGNRTSQETAQQFLADQIKEYEGRLTAAENRLAEFKKSNLGLVPGERGDYFSRMQAEQNARDDVTGRLNVMISKRDALTEQLRGEAAYIPVLDPAKGGSKDGGIGGDTATRLMEAETRLQELLLRFTEKHPDVVATRAMIADLRERQERELAALKGGDIAEAGTTAARINPAYQRIQQSIHDIDVEIAALRREINDRNQRISELRKLADTAPEVEAEYARLNRDYGVTKAQYEALVERLERAKITEEAEATGVMKFEVLEPPRATLKPVSPNRPLIAAAVLILALGGGLGAAYVKHMTKPVFFSTRALSNALERPVLGAVSFARPEAWVAAQKASIRYVMMSTAALVMVFVLVLITQNSFSRWLQQVMLAQV